MTVNLLYTEHYSYIYCQHWHNSPNVRDSIQSSSHFVDCIIVGVLLRYVELSNVMECFDVIGALLDDTELMDIFTGCSVVARLLLSDLCMVECFTGISVLLNDSIVVAVEKVFIGVLIKPVDQSLEDKEASMQ